MLSVLDYQVSDLKILKDEYDFQEIMRSESTPVFTFRENDKISGFAVLELEDSQIKLISLELSEDISAEAALFFIKVICVKAMDFGYDRLLNETLNLPLFKKGEEIIFQEFLKSCSHD